MAVYIIEGSTPLHGNIRVHGAKNAALPVLAAALLPPESEIEGCPRLSDTAAAMNILRSLGCRVEQQPDGTAQVDSRSAQGWEIPESCMREMRSSIIFLGAILTRYGRARVSFPGGCELGPRPIDLHLAALERMGAVIREDHGALDCTVPMGRLHGAEIVLSFPSVGATQNVLIALIVDGVDSLHAVRHRVIPDRIAAATYLCCAAAAGGSITVEGCVPAHLAAVLPPLEQAGCRVRTWRDAVAITVPERLGSLGWVRTMPYPGFPTDAQAPLMAAALRADGTTVFTETIFQNRYRHVSEMARMGAHVRTEGKVAIVTGVPRLHGASVRCTDLRGGAALCAAALAAEGQSVIAEIHHIERGYEHLDESLRQLGANITRSDHETEAEETQTEQPTTSEEGAGA